MTIIIFALSLLVPKLPIHWGFWYTKLPRIEEIKIPHLDTSKILCQYNCYFFIIYLLRADHLLVNSWTPMKQTRGSFVNSQNSLGFSYLHLPSLSSHHPTPFPPLPLSPLHTTPQPHLSPPPPTSPPLPQPTTFNSPLLPPPLLSPLPTTSSPP